MKRKTSLKRISLVLVTAVAFAALLWGCRLPGGGYTPHKSTSIDIQWSPEVVQFGQGELDGSLVNVVSSKDGSFVLTFGPKSSGPASRSVADSVSRFVVGKTVLIPPNPVSATAVIGTVAEVALGPAGTVVRIAAPMVLDNLISSIPAFTVNEAISKTLSFPSSTGSDKISLVAEDPADPAGETTIDLSPVLRGSLGIEYGQLYFDYVDADNYDFSFSGQIDGEIVFTVKAGLSDTLLGKALSVAVPIRLFESGAITVLLRPKLSVKLETKGELTITARFQDKVAWASKKVDGLTVESGVQDPFDPQPSISFIPQTAASVGLKGTVELKLEVMLCQYVGVFVTPSLSLTLGAAGQTNLLGYVDYFPFVTAEGKCEIGVGTEIEHFPRFLKFKLSHVFGPLSYSLFPADGPPLSLSLSTGTSNTLNLQWTRGNANTVGYLVQRGVSGGQYVDLTTVESRSAIAAYADSGLLGGTSYYYRVIGLVGSSRRRTTFSNETFGAPQTQIGTMTITSPTSSSAWQAASSHTIRWTASGTLDGSVSIDLYSGNILSSVIDSGTPNDGSYDWTIPAGISSGSQYRIKLTSTSSNSSAYSDYFTLSPPAKTLTSITLTPSSTSLAATSAGWSLTGVSVTAYFSDGTSSVYGNGYTWAKISGPGSFNPSTAYYTVSGTGTAIIRCSLTVAGVTKTADYTITTDKILTSITLTPSSTSLTATSAGWSLTGVSVTAYFSDGTSSVYGNGYTWAKISGPGSFNPSTAYYTVSGTGTAIIRCSLTVAGVTKTADYTITTDKTLTSITLTPNRTSLTSTSAGWSLTGVSVTAYFSDGTSSVYGNGYTWAMISGPGSFNPSTAYYTVSGAPGTAIIRCSLTVAGVTKTADYTITTDKTLSSITLTPSNKSLTATSAGWSLTGVSVTAYFSDGTSSVYGNGYTWTRVSGPGSFNASTSYYTVSGTGTAIIRCSLTTAGVTRTADYTITVQ